MKRFLALMLLLGFNSALAATQTQALQRGSYQKILTAHAGKPLIVAMWSVSCTHCGTDLEIFQKLSKKYPDFNLVLISTDTPEQEEVIVARLKKYHLNISAPENRNRKLESWVFADSFSERLRYEIDPQWYGELPRTYFIDAAGNRRAESGVLDAKETEQWWQMQR